MELFSAYGITEFLFRWFHFLAGITWIGMLYYFNFVQTPFFGSKFVADNPAVRGGIVRGGLLNNALWWFRWGAMFTFITGLLIIAYRMHGAGVYGYLSTPRGLGIAIGGLLGTTMWFNVWFVIWPNQQVVMASAEQVATGGTAIPDAAARGTRAGVTSRTNTMLSIPMLFFMASGSHVVWAAMTRTTKVSMLVLMVIVIAAAEINALVGTAGPGKKMLSTVKGTLWAGFVITAIFWIVSLM